MLLKNTEIKVRLDQNEFSGKLIDNIRYIQKGDKAVVDTNDLQSGIYIMDVTTKLGHSRVKVVIQK